MRERPKQLIKVTYQTKGDSSEQSAGKDCSYDSDNSNNGDKETNNNKQDTHRGIVSTIRKEVEVGTA